MATLEELKRKVDLHDLADRLSVRRSGNVRAGKAQYHSPHRPDKNPSISVWTDADGTQRWKDHAANQGGTCIDFVMYVESLADVGEAIKRVSELTGIELDRAPASGDPKPERTRVDYIADKCLESAELCREYLRDRGICEPVLDAAIRKKTLGFNTWTNDKVAAGQPMHGGPAVAFIVRTMNPGHVAAVDMRYVDAALNGGVKTTCQGEKAGYPWTSDLKKLEHSKTVYLVESPINALSVETAFGWPEASRPVAAVATRGVAAVDSIDWRFLRGKRVLICMDHRDKEDEKRGERPGLAAAWRLHELLTAIDVGALLVDQSQWEEGEDVNDVLKKHGAERLKVDLTHAEPWLIPGMSGDGEVAGRRRIFLPDHDWRVYGRYRVKDDFTAYISKWTTKQVDGEEDAKIPQFEDLAGFRVASLSRVSIASATATMTGEEDSSPEVLFAASVQTPRHGPKLVKRVFDDQHLHNVEKWKQLGPVFNQATFLRMVNILERAAGLTSRDATNFVGLAWRGGKLVVNEGTDCYFSDPEKQCPYSRLIFPAGHAGDAKRVIQAYQATFMKNAATIPLVWGLGGHLKVLLGFWPHLTIQADKGAGKSTFIGRLQRTLGFTMFSGQSLQTEFRLLTSISHTSHLVGWEEISARGQQVIDKAVSLLQECYQYTYTTRGSDMTKYLLSAPVLLAGEDVPVPSLIGKLIRSELTGKKGVKMADNLPRFPVRQWLEWLTRLERDHVRSLHLRMEEHFLQRSMAAGSDDGATRMASNYAAVATAWLLLCEWLDLDPKQGDFHVDLSTEMNRHIADTKGARQPWVWIVERLLSEISKGQFHYPHKWDTIDGRACLLVRTGHVMDHLSTTPALREMWNALTIKSERVFKRQLQQAEVVLLDAGGAVQEFERSLGSFKFEDTRRRIAHMVALDVGRLSEYGLYADPVGLGDPLGVPPGPPDE